MTYEELEILIKNRRTSERRAELVRAIPSEKEEAKGNDDITQPHSSNPHNKLIANVLYTHPTLRDGGWVILKPLE